MTTNEQAARSEAEKRWPPARRPLSSVDWQTTGMREGFVLGSQWAESALLARLRDPDPALEAVLDEATAGGGSPGYGLQAIAEYLTRCHCPPCPGRGTDGHGMEHCAECCFGSGVEADPRCPIHGQAAHLMERTDPMSASREDWTYAERGAFESGRRALLARLSDPDPALVDAVAEAIRITVLTRTYAYDAIARVALTTAAAHLTDPTPTEDGGQS